MSTNKLSALASAWVPEFVREQGPNFVAFIEAWIAWMEEDRGIVDAHLHAMDWKDIDRSLESFVEFFHNEFMPSIPRQVLVDRRLLIKHIRSFYRAKGSQKAYRLLFRILFDEEIEFYYPGRDILRASGARWVIDRSVTITPYDLEFDFSTLENAAVMGSVSGATALVESVRWQIVNGVQTYVVWLSNVSKPFVAQDVLRTGATAIGRVEGYTVHPGRFAGTYGFLSSDKYLQGPHYYQEYSYVLRTAQPLSRYKEIVKKLVHPAGTALFGQVDSTYRPDLLPEVIVEPYEVELLLETVELAPVIVTSTEFGDTSVLDELRLVYEADAPVDVGTGSLSRLLVLTGTLATANITTFAAIGSDTFAKYGSWTMADFSNGRGIIGTATQFLTQAVEGNLITIYAAGEDDFLGFVESIDTNTTMTIEPAHPAHPITGATAETEVEA
jgi:hypothetical protein